MAFDVFWNEVHVGRKPIIISVKRETKW
jgi:hypothetical protein